MTMMMTHPFSFLSTFEAENKNTHLHIDQNKNIHAGDYYFSSTINCNINSKQKQKRLMIKDLHRNAN